MLDAAERALRKQLEQQFGGMDLTDRKPLIRVEVSLALTLSCACSHVRACIWVACHKTDQHEPSVRCHAADADLTACSAQANLMAQVEAFLAEQDPVEEEEDEAAEEEEEAAPRRGGSGGGSGLSEAMQAFLGEVSLPRPQARRCCHALKPLSARLFRSHAIKLPCKHAPAAWKPCADIAACQLQVVKRLWEYIKANKLQVCQKQQNRLTKTQGFMHPF